MSLTEAQGYFDLGLYDDAWQSIEDQPTEDRESCDAFKLRLKILAATDRWEQCHFLSDGLVQSDPSWPLPKLLGAEALDKQGEIERALAFLVAGEVHLQNEPGFWYQLGSYHARLGDALEAKEAVARLAQLAPDLRVKVLEDPAYEAVWANIVREVRSGVLALGSRLAPEIVGLKTERKIKARIDKEAHILLSDLSNEGKG